MNFNWNNHVKHRAEGGFFNKRKKKNKENNNWDACECLLVRWWWDIDVLNSGRLEWLGTAGADWLVSSYSNSTWQVEEIFLMAGWWRRDLSSFISNLCPGDRAWPLQLVLHAFFCLLARTWTGSQQLGRIMWKMIIFNGCMLVTALLMN